MDGVKTYHRVNRENDAVSFGISRMEDIYVKHNGKPDEPHRHDYYTIVFPLKAKGKHIIDFNAYPLQDQEIFFISPGQVHQIIEEKASIGYSIVFNQEFLIQNNIPTAFIDELNLFQTYEDQSALELTAANCKELKDIAEKLLDLQHTEIQFKTAAIAAQLQYFLIVCNNACNKEWTENTQHESGNNLLRNFKQLINEHYKEWHHISAYAEALHVTPDHLNRVVKALTGKTAKEHVQSRITIAAKRLLYFSPLSNKEISYELGFSEAGNFSAFFKKCTGKSPSAFKTMD